jgi:hypothetical protein
VVIVSLWLGGTFHAVVWGAFLSEIAKSKGVVSDAFNRIEACCALTSGYFQAW